MYRDVYRIYNAQLYAFSNGDILYDTGLVQTLNSTIAVLMELNTTMIVGRRWNYHVNPNYDVYINNSLWKPDKVKELANPQTSELFWTYAQDFFFVTKDFPWQDIADVVIGRPGYDNYLLAMAIDLNISTIDATATLAAVHQTGDDGNHAGFKYKDFNYNLDVIGDFDYEKGDTTHTKLKSMWREQPIKIVPQ